MSEERCAVITGGAQGIGKATARRLLDDGWSVTIADIDDEAGRETAEEYAAYGRLLFVPTDVADEGQVQQMISATVARFGGIDLLVNNAYTSANGPLTELSLEAWNRVVSVNLTGAFLCAKYAVPHLRARHGCIVNIASTRALMSQPDTEAYSASKGGLLALTHALAISLGPEIRVNCISPGWIETGDWKKARLRQTPVHSEADAQQHPVGRVGVPDDIAAAVLFLASNDAEFLTGQNMVIDGGMTKRMIYV